jgi:hypothetical protein
MSTEDSIMLVRLKPDLPGGDDLPEAGIWSSPRGPVDERKADGDLP